MLAFTLLDTRWGACAFVSDGPRLVATFLPVRKRSMIRQTVRRRWPAAVEAPNALRRLQRDLVAYFEGGPVTFDVPLALDELTPFRRLVMGACRRIPYGQRATYGDLARAAGSPAAGRAVGSVMAANPVPLVVPCHRVVRSDGTLGGFSSPEGVRLKERLLALETQPC